MNDLSEKSGQLNQRISKYIDELATLTDEARASAAMQAYLEGCARFHRYSPHNQLLIMLARPDASRVAGYRDWITHHRYVRKGEKGIPILAPCKTRPKDDEEDPRLYFRVVYVFDVSQTDGEPLPPPPDWKSPEKNRELSDRLIAVAERLGIPFSVGALTGTAQGVSRKNGGIQVIPEAGTLTMIHELAHQLMGHHDADFSHAERECEAEAVGFVVASHFGLRELNSPNYLALWNVDPTIIRSRIERISRCGSQIISELEANPSCKPEKE